MGIEFEISTIIPVTPEEVYAAWLDSEKHASMTGGGASIHAQVGAEFEAWDGYITGRNLELDPGKRIVQSWRTLEFQEAEADSRIEVTLEPIAGGTRLTLRHTNLPPHGMQYKQGWVDSYFEPMLAYFQQV